MEEFKTGANWQAGDKLYYVLGTEVHVNEIEHSIASSAGAQQLEDGGYVANHLELNVNGRKMWFIHHGARAGRGPNEGNSLRNWLRDVYFDVLKDHESEPDVIVSGHVHQPTYNTFVANEGMVFRVVHGVILPSWQAKTRFAYKVAPVAKNRIGGMMQVVTDEGDIRPPQFCVFNTNSMTKG